MNKAEKNYQVKIWEKIDTQSNGNPVACRVTSANYRRGGWEVEKLSRALVALQDMGRQKLESKASQGEGA